MTVDEVMRERAALLARKFSHGLTDAEMARLDWLKAQARRLCPTVTSEMKAAIDAMRARIDARQARRELPNAPAHRPDTAR